MSLVRFVTLFAFIASAGCGARTDLGTAVGNVAHPVVLFGGFDGTTFLSDTWVWNGAWTKLDVVGPRFARCGTMVPLDGKLVLAGVLPYGQTTSEDLTSTWMWDGATWSNQTTAGPPGAFCCASIAVLGTNLVMFGGLDGDPPGNRALSDTWTWDGKVWTNVAVDGPSARSNAVMASLDGSLVLFGGDDANGNALSDTWTWDGTSWRQQEVTGPSARVGAVMASLGNVVVLFGGEEQTPSGHAFSDTWIWNGSVWTELGVSGPPARSWSVMAPFDGKLVLFGGINGELIRHPWDMPKNLFSDTWTWDGNEWSRLDVVGPSPRFQGVMSTR